MLPSGEAEFAGHAVHTPSISVNPATHLHVACPDAETEFSPHGLHGALPGSYLNVLSTHATQFPTGPVNPAGQVSTHELTDVLPAALSLPCSHAVQVASL